MESPFPIPHSPSRRPSDFGPRTSRARRAFTLIEIVGTLVVIAILAAVTAYHLLEHLKRSMREHEQAQLERFGDGLKQYILRTRTVPAPATWAQNAAGELGLVLTDVTLNKVRQPRVLLIDPAFRIGNVTGANLPYTQAIRGATNGLANARFLLLSSLNNPLPAAVATPGPNNYFNDLWESVDDVTPAFWTNLGGLNWPDVRVHRIPLDPLFVRVTLNYEGSLQGRFAADNTACAGAITLPTSPFSTHYLASTRLSLFGADCAAANPLQLTEVLLESHAYAFQNGIWRGRLFLGTTARRLGGQDLQAAYDLFMASTANSMAKFGTVQVDCAQAMVDYMQRYITWANGGFGNNSSLRSAQTDLAWDTKNFVWRSSSQNH